MKLNRNWVIAFGLYFLVLLTIIGLAYWGILPVKVSAIPFYDTIGHFILLGSASYLGHKALGGQMSTIWLFPFALPVAPLIISVFAAVDESLQALSPLRTSTLSDMTANLVGIWAFYVLARWK
jgi:VanZ family protein